MKKIVWNISRKVLKTFPPSLRACSWRCVGWGVVCEVMGLVMGLLLREVWMFDAVFGEVRGRCLGYNGILLRGDFFRFGGIENEWD